MQRICVYSAHMFQAGICLLAVCMATAASAEGNIDNTAKYAWSENSGWQNWRPTYGGVSVVKSGDQGYLAGYAWSENVGWMKLGSGNGPYLNTASNNYGVNMDAAGRLSGYVWSENSGWINFSNALTQVTITGGSFDGYAWSENIGFVHFRNGSPAYNVRAIPAGTILLVH